VGKSASAKRGTKFEQLLGRKLKLALPPRLAEVLDDQWVRYWLEGGKRGSAGLRWAQMDLAVVGKHSVVIGECKLTQQRAGRQELRRLYVPLAKVIWPGKAIVPVMFFNQPTEAEYEEGRAEEFVRTALTRPLADGVGVIDFRVDWADLEASA